MSKMMDVYTKESTCEIILFMVNKILEKDNGNPIDTSIVVPVRGVV
jgi:hypothetical protein